MIRNLNVLVGLLLGGSVAIASGIYVVPDDVYATKSEMGVVYTTTATTEVEVEETYPDEVTIAQPTGETNDVLIADPTLETYTEGFIVYKGEDGRNDTVYVYGNPEDYLQQDTIKRVAK